MSKSHLLLAVPALAALLACGASDSTPKVALGTTGASAEGTGANPGVLPLAAKAALDAGNAAYRAKQFPLAIDKYREAAVEAPAHAAPWFGVYMAANELKNAALADSAMARVKALSADTTSLSAHADVTTGGAAGALPPGHPSANPQLPPGHPITQPQLPPGHPAPVKRP